MHKYWLEHDPAALAFWDCNGGVARDIHLTPLLTKITNTIPLSSPLVLHLWDVRYLPLEAWRNVSAAREPPALPAQWSAR